MSFLELLWLSLEPVKEPLLFLAVTWAGLAAWLIRDFARYRREVRRLADERAYERQELRAWSSRSGPPMSIWDGFPPDCPWRPEAHTHKR